MSNWIIIIICRWISLSPLSCSIFLLTHKSNWKLTDINWSIWASMNILLMNYTIDLLFIVLRILIFWILYWFESRSVTTLWHLNLLLSNFHFFRIAFVIACHFSSWREKSSFTTCSILSLVKSILFKLLAMRTTSYCSACSNSCNVSVICSITILSFHWLYNRSIEVNHQVFIDCIFIWRFWLCNRSCICSSGLGSSVESSNSVICIWIIFICSILNGIIVNWVISLFCWLINEIIHCFLIIFDVFYNWCGHIQILLLIYWIWRFCFIILINCLIYINSVFDICSQSHFLFEINFC